MCLFKRKKTSYIEEMRKQLKAFMLQYIKDYPMASDTVIPIFSNVEEMLKNSSERDITKLLKSNNINVECAILNIIQNFAMAELKPKSGVDFLKSSDDYALELYNYTNALKLEKGYISKEQYEENKMLGVKMSLQSPLGNWF